MKLVTYLILPLLVLGADDNPDKKAKKEERKSVKLPPCQACESLVKSFDQGMDKTKRGKFEGGDTDWEEKKQSKGYANSEVRFVEIQEGLCHNIGRGETQCHENHHEWEEHLEAWWGQGDDRPALRQFLCVDTLKACCPEDHFGPTCEKCTSVGQNGLMCSGNGKCKGSGTRKGNGRCLCDKGYGGDYCETCGVGFYNSYKDEDKLLCSECHKSCLSHCTGSGPKGCIACKGGFTMHSEHGCQDIDECELSRPCPENKFCVNTEGSFQCVRCDKSCESCVGDGPDQCNECADGYEKNKDGVCISQDAAGRIFNISNTRYFTYIGLFIAAVIIFPKNPWVAGLLGVVIASYITFSEYYLSGATGELRPIST